jgi:hypothetical protein
MLNSFSDIFYKLDEQIRKFLAGFGDSNEEETKVGKRSKVPGSGSSSSKKRSVKPRSCSSVNRPKKVRGQKDGSDVRSRPSKKV